MKKTLIALLALGSVAMATDLRVQNGETYELGVNTNQVDHLIFGASDADDLTGTYTTVVKAGYENKLWSIMRNKSHAVGSIDFSLENNAVASTKSDAGNMNWNAKQISITLGDGASMTFGNSLNMKYADQTALTITLGAGSTLTFGGRASLGIDNSAKHEALTLNFGAGSSISAGNQVISFGDIMQNSSSSLTLNAALTDDEFTKLITEGAGTIVQRTLMTAASIDHLTDCGGTVTGSIAKLDALGYISKGVLTNVDSLQDGEYAFYKNGGSLVMYIKGNGNVPEPTTGTLSLLALAGLMTRRRRK